VLESLRECHRIFELVTNKQGFVNPGMTLPFTHEVPARVSFPSALISQTLQRAQVTAPAQEEKKIFW